MVPAGRTRAPGSLHTLYLQFGEQVARRGLGNIPGQGGKVGLQRAGGGAVKGPGGQVGQSDG